MNVKNNQRFQETERKIKNAFLDLLGNRLLDDITVGDICLCADVNRSTFYAHYDSAETLLEAMDEDMSRQLMAVFEDRPVETTTNRDRYLIPYLHFLLDNRAFYRAYFRNSNQYIFKHDLYAVCRASLGYCLRAMPQQTKHPDLLVAYHTTGIYALIREWANRNFDLTPEEMADVLEECGSDIYLPAQSAVAE